MARSERSQSRGRADSGPQRSRTNSQSSRRSRNPSLTRVASGHLNDASTYYDQHDDHVHQYELPRNSSVTDTEKADGSDLAPRDSEEAVEEVEDGQEFDVEKAVAPGGLKKKQSSSSVKRDPNIIGWDGPDDPQNPKNWTLRHKWAAISIVSAFTFLSPTTSTIVAPALPQMERDLGYNSEFLGGMMLSIFILGYACGPLFLGPLSEMYGRVIVLQLANLFFLAFNIGCGFAQNGGQMLAFRLLAGIGGSAPLAIGGGVLGDCFKPEQRGLAISIYSLGPLLGPAIGPVCGGFIAQYSTWRWAFWATSILDGVVQVLGFFLLQETYAPLLLHRKTQKLIKETGNTELRSEFDDHSSIPLHRKFSTALSRPFILLFTQPIIITMAVYMAYLYGIAYLVTTTFASLWTDRYGESVSIGSLHYIAQMIGYFIGAQIGSRFNDWMYVRLKTRNNGVGRPEFRVPPLAFCAVLMPIGIFWYGWSAEAKIFWIMPDIGVSILSAAIIFGFQAIQTYVIDAYTRYAASGIAATTVLRSLAGFGFPLFAAPMYNKLGYGWSNTILGCIALVIGLPAPLILWRYGEALRKKSQFAAGGD